MQGMENQYDDVFTRLRTFSVPHTLVKVSRAFNGHLANVWILGTNHVSKKSPVQVKKLIDEIKPEAVAVELSADKAVRLLQQDMTGLEEKASINIKQPIYSLLSVVHKTNAQRLGTTPGGEFRAALQAAHECGSDVLFADRPPSITGKRVWRNISITEAFNLAAMFFMAGRRRHAQTSQNMLNSMESIMIDDSVSHTKDSFIPRIRDASQTVGDIWIDERDQFMASAITQVLLSESGRVKNLVAIVGEAHVEGVAAQLSKSRLPSLSDLDRIQDQLLEIPPPTLTSSVLLPAAILAVPVAAVALPSIGVVRFARWAGPILSRWFRR